LLAALVFHLLDVDLQSTPYLHIIRGLQIPGDSGMSYISKLRMFLTPSRFVTLDQVLLNGLRNPPGVATRNLLDSVVFDKDHETAIRIDDQNEDEYRRWALFCRRIAENDFAGHQAHGRPVLASDIERGFYNMMRDGHGVSAARNPKPPRTAVAGSAIDETHSCRPEPQTAEDLKHLQCYELWLDAMFDCRGRGCPYDDCGNPCPRIPLHPHPLHPLHQSA